MTPSCIAVIVGNRPASIYNIVVNNENYSICAIHYTAERCVLYIVLIKSNIAIILIAGMWLNC